MTKHMKSRCSTNSNYGLPSVTPGLRLRARGRIVRNGGQLRAGSFSSSRGVSEFMQCALETYHLGPLTCSERETHEGQKDKREGERDE